MATYTSRKASRWKCFVFSTRQTRIPAIGGIWAFTWTANRPAIRGFRRRRTKRPYVCRGTKLGPQRSKVVTTPSPVCTTESRASALATFTSDVIYFTFTSFRVAVSNTCHFKFRSSFECDGLWLHIVQLGETRMHLVGAVQSHHH